MVIEQKFVRDIIELHDKYMEYVITCFLNNPLFHRAMTEACEGFCQKNVAGTSTAELFANFCDNLLKKAKQICMTGRSISVSGRR